MCCIKFTLIHGKFLFYVQAPSLEYTKLPTIAVFHLYCLFGTQYLQYDRDPRRLMWLGDSLLKLPHSDDGDMSTAAEARMLSFYQILIGELSWRGPGPSADLLEYIRANISHPYKLVRDRMAR